MLDVDQALDWLFSTQFFGIKPGLAQTRVLLDRCGAQVPNTVKVIHVAGTNGKGSTCAMIEALLRKGGYKTGLFTSPHLVRYNERIRVNGEEIGEEALLRHLRAVRKAVENCDPHPTFFELSFAIALRYFSEQSVDILILETGMGGRLDATNAVRKDLCVLVPIGVDHTQYLGETLAEIAGEKAGIIHSCVPVVSAVQQDEVLAVIRQKAKEQGSLLSLATDIENTPSPSLFGLHQKENATLALLAVHTLGIVLRPEQITSALSQVSWPGRFEYDKEHHLILDAAHNEHAMRTLVKTWRETYGEEKVTVIFAASADKNIVDMLTVLSEIVGVWRLVPCSSPRIMLPSKMVEQITSLSSSPVSVYSSIGDALAERGESVEPCLVTGSIFLLGDVKALLEKQHTRETMQ